MMKTIFVVDDNRTNLLMAEDVLSTSYEVITLLSATTLFEILEEGIPDLILLDIMMPNIDGFAALKKLKNNKQHMDIPVIFLTSKNDAETEALGFEMGVIDFITKPFSAPVLLHRVRSILHMESIIRERTDMLQKQAKELKKQKEMLKQQTITLEEQKETLILRTEKLLRLQNSLTSILANMVENRDKLTGKHIERTASYLKIMLNYMIDNEIYIDELKDWNIDVNVSAARLHDLGKITVSDLILNKTDKLTEEEFDLIKAHTTEGENIINDIIRETGDEDFLKNAKLFAGSHHERWDGTGYPSGLKGTEIPLHGRIMAIADVYDALVSDRPYKKAFTHERAVEIMLENKGTHFDPQIVDVFIAVNRLFAEVYG
ncbi:MAG: response regulator [Lachnospiraceae bacterium]|nr:response regulator [Lachnospiraceae bacterium]